MRKFKICLINPGHPSQCPRLVKEADALSERGHEVSVIAPIFSDWAHEADVEFADRKWRIVARPRFGPKSSPWIRATELTRRAVAGFLTKQAGLDYPSLIRAAHHPAAPALVREAKRIRADLYIAHREIALPAAAMAARTHGARYVFDAEDFHLGEFPDTPEYANQRRFVRGFEAPYLKGCALTTAASAGIADNYALEYEIPRPSVVLNVFPLAQAPATWTPSGSAKPRPSLYWFSQTIGPGRGLECAARAIARARSKPHLYLRGVPKPGYMEKLCAIAESEGAAGRIHVLPMAQPSSLERLAAAYDIGLSGEECGTKNSGIALSNKLFSFLLAGLPLAMSASPANLAFAKELGQAARIFPVGDADALADILDAWLGRPEELAAARKAAWVLGQRRFNWDVEKQTYIAAIERVLDAA